MKVSLKINGEERTFSGVESITILENSKDSKETEQRVGSWKSMLFNNHPLVNGEWFSVDYKTIDTKLFEEEREYGEFARRLILEAFEEVRKNPEKYAKVFLAKIPKEIEYAEKSYEEISTLLAEKNQHIADWVELALIWAQRITDGEKWEVLYMDCYNVSPYERFVIWKDGRIAIVGGSSSPYSLGYPEKHISSIFEFPCMENRHRVPVIIS